MGATTCFRRLVPLLTACLALCSSTQPVAAELVTGKIRDTAVIAHDNEKFTLQTHFQVAGPAGRTFRVFYQARMAGSHFLKQDGDRYVLVPAGDVTMPAEKLIAHWADYRFEFPVRELAAATNLPKDCETVVWIDCSLWDTSARQYVTADFDVSAPVLVRTDGAGRLLSVDPKAAYGLLLKDADWRVRAQVRDLVRGSPVKARMALPSAIAALDSSDSGVRLWAVLALREVTPAPKEAMNALTESLADPDPLIRVYAAEGLDRHGRGDRALSVLAAVLREKDDSARQSALALLAKLGRPAVPVLREALRSPEWDVRNRAASALLGLGAEGGAATTTLLEGFRSGPAFTKGAMIVRQLLLDGVGPQCADAVPVLVEVLSARPQRSDVVRRVSVEALGKIGPGARAAVPALAEIAGRKESPERLLAIAALGRIGAEAREAMPVLSEALNDLAPPTRARAALSLWQISRSGDALRVLIADLRAAGADGRLEAARACRDVGSEARATLPALVEALEDADDSVRWQAAYALSQFGADAVPGLVRAMRQGPREGRTHATAQLGLLKDAGRTAVPDLREMLHDADKWQRYAAANALGNIGPAAQAVFQDLVEAARGDDQTMVKVALEALPKIDPLAAKRLGVF